jgi:hypothetical protein
VKNDKLFTFESKPRGGGQKKGQGIGGRAKTHFAVKGQHSPPRRDNYSANHD